MNRPNSTAPSCSAFGGLSALAASILLLAFQPNARAQSDNFDSGVLSPAWTVYDASSSLVSLTFPAVGTGKGLRIQVNPYPSVVQAVAGLFQTNNVYTDFYLAVDMVNWVVEDQAAVLSARFTRGAPSASMEVRA